MKKLIFVALGAALLSLGACSTSAEKAEKNEKDLSAKIENCTNPDSLKVYVEQAKDYAQKLISEGKLDEAKKYLDQIEPVVKEKAPSLAGVFSTIKGAVVQIPAAAGNAADSIKAKAAAAGDSIKSAAAAKVDDAKSAVKEAADKQKEKAADEAGKAIDNAADKLKDVFKK